MTKPKINHPFLVPDDFFIHLEPDLKTELDKISYQGKKRSVILQVMKYAAIIFVAVFLGRMSVKIFPGNNSFTGDPETISVDLVLSQVPDEDITEFILNNISQEALNQ